MRVLIILCFFFCSLSAQSAGYIWFSDVNWTPDAPEELKREARKLTNVGMLQFQVSLEGKSYYATIIFSDNKKTITDVRSEIKLQNEIRAQVDLVHPWVFQQFKLEHPDLPTSVFDELEKKRPKFDPNSVRVIVRRESHRGPIVGHFRAGYETNGLVSLERELEGAWTFQKPKVRKISEYDFIGSTLQIQELIALDRHVAAVVHLLLNEVGLHYVRPPTLNEIPLDRLEKPNEWLPHHSWSEVWPSQVVLVTTETGRDLVGYYERLNARKLAQPKELKGQWVMESSIGDYLNWSNLSFHFRNGLELVKESGLMMGYESEDGYRTLPYMVSPNGIFALDTGQFLQQYPGVRAPINFAQDITRRPQVLYSDLRLMLRESCPLALDPAK